jgi:hypothetical protein
MRLIALTPECGSGGCPQIYETDSGTIVVQGKVVRPDAAAVTVGAGEGFVEIPMSLLLAVVQKINVGEASA